MEKIISDYNELITKAIAIARAENTYVDEEDFASLAINGDKATLTWQECKSGYYDSTSIETQVYPFPAVQLTWTPEEVKAHYEAERKARAERLKAEQQELAVRQAANRIREEKTTYERLHAKYGKQA